VKPIAVQAATGEGVVMKAPNGKIPALIATESYFLLFRYIAFLYERLEKAKSLAHNAEYPRNKPAHEEAANKEWARTHPNEDKMQVDGEEDQQQQGPFDSAAAEARYVKHFLEPLESLLNNPSDPVAFEDEVRTHLGVEAFVLFTTDRILQIIVKQIQSIVADDDLYDQLLGLYKYEFTRPDGFMDSAYLNNARDLLKDERRCFRFTYSPETGDFGMSELSLVPVQQPPQNPIAAMNNSNAMAVDGAPTPTIESQASSYVPH
jgi:histone deacetylase complex regulatory component SIN3